MEGQWRLTNRLAKGLRDLFSRTRVDPALMEELESLLIAADLGPRLAARLCTEIEEEARSQPVTEERAIELVRARLTGILRPCALPLPIRPDSRPHTILVMGVNGSGKTTTIGKLAHFLAQNGRKTVLAGADTFRAAAQAQLRIWGERAGARVVEGMEGGDPASVAHEAWRSAHENGEDVLLVDTAGRQQNREDLMAQLVKINKVLNRLDPASPHDRLLVLDGTTGLNTFGQVEMFNDAVSITGLIMTKLDGSARGGGLVALAERFALPVHALGSGEEMTDLEALDVDRFVDGLLGDR